MYILNLPRRAGKTRLAQQLWAAQQMANHADKIERAVQQIERAAQQLAMIGNISTAEAKNALANVLSTTGQQLTPETVHRIGQAMFDELSQPLPHHQPSIARINHHWKDQSC